MIKILNAFQFTALMNFSTSIPSLHPSVDSSNKQACFALVITNRGSPAALTGDIINVNSCRNTNCNHTHVLKGRTSSYHHHHDAFSRKSCSRVQLGGKLFLFHSDALSLADMHRRIFSSLLYRFANNALVKNCRDKPNRIYIYITKSIKREMKSKRKKEIASSFSQIFF